MSSNKTIEVSGLGAVTFRKRHNARSVRITIDHNSNVRVSLPSWTPYKVALAFVETKRAWIRKHQALKAKHVFRPNERIGKAHRLLFASSTTGKVATRVTDTEITVRLPQGHTSTDVVVQSAVEKAAVRALKKEAKELLLPRLRDFAHKHGFDYKSASIKHLKSRWGSCSSEQYIALNCFLMQLPWQLIDYVLLHELVHTRVMAHGPKFWSELEKYVPDLKNKRSLIKNYHPALRPQD